MSKIWWIVTAIVVMGLLILAVTPNGPLYDQGVQVWACLNGRNDCL